MKLFGVYRHPISLSDDRRHEIVWQRLTYVILAILFLIPFLVLAYLNQTNTVNADTPTITAVSPNNGPVDGGTTVTITGTNFQQDKIKKVSAGGEHTCVLTISGKAYCWGLNSSGQLGDGTTTDSATPVAVSTNNMANDSAFANISAKGDTTCGITTAGKAYCWGNNSNGQLGDGTITQRTTPVAVSTSGVLSGKTIISLSVGADKSPLGLVGTSTCALTNEGKIYCWGYNSNGGLGDGSVIERHTPVAVDNSGALSGKTITTISNGGGHVCAIDSDKSLYCWGYNDYGQVGDNTTTQRTTPVNVNVASKQVESVTAGGINTCALTTDAQPYCWGNNYYGQIGDGTSGNGNTRLTPTAVTTSGALSGKTVTAISTGGSFYPSLYYYDTSCALTSDGKAYCWGYNGNGQLGDTSGTNKTTPVAVYASGVLNGKTLTSINQGSAHICTLADTNSVHCWGYNSKKQLGDNSGPTSSSVPVTANTSNVAYESIVVLFDNIPSPHVTYISSTELTAITPAHTAGYVDIVVTNPDTTSSATLEDSYYYGYSPPTVDSISPDNGSTDGGTAVTVTGTNFFRLGNLTGISAGTNHSCAVANGKAYCWGYNLYGRLGNNSTSNSTVPVAVDTGGVLNDKTVTSISAGSYHSCAVADGKAYCWGSNYYGQLGNNSTSNSSVPVAVDTSGVLNGKTVTSISAGDNHSCAVADGKAYCWGYNLYGRLGNNSTSNSTVPVAVDTGGVLNDKTVTSVSAGSNHSCAVASGSAYCWGYNNYGGLGNNSTSNSSVPVAVDTSGVLNGKTVTSVSAGDDHSCAVASGSAYCWGYNNYGGLGNNSTSNSSVPVAVDTSGVLNNRTVTSVSAGANISSGVDHSCAVADDQAYCWGSSSYGQLGNNSTSNSSVPVAVDTSGVLNNRTVTSVSAGTFHSCAVVDNKGYCWGSNYYGQLGNNSTSNSSVPVAVNDSLWPGELLPSVTIGGAATNISFVSSTELTATTTSHASGVVDVAVTNPDSQVGTLTNGYTYLPDPPSAPKNLATTPSDSSVILNWQVPDDDGGGAITDYKVEYSDDGGETWQTFSHMASNNTTISVTGLSAGITYTFRVSAINLIGAGDPSNEATGTPIYITLDTSGNVLINILPQGTTTMSSNSHNLTLDTNSPNGFHIGLEMISATRNLANGASTISPSAGTTSSPTSMLVNTWGFRVDEFDGFGSGPTVAETNVTSSGYTWAGVPAGGSPITIKSSTSPAEDDETTVWYGLSASNTKSSGSYTGTVLYTAVAN